MRTATYCLKLTGKIREFLPYWVSAGWPSFVFKTLGTRLMAKYTDEQIEEACEKCVQDWDLETLRDFAVQELVHHYTTVSHADSLEAFMKGKENDI